MDTRDVSDPGQLHDDIHEAVIIMIGLRRIAAEMITSLAVAYARAAEQLDASPDAKVDAD